MNFPAIEVEGLGKRYKVNGAGARADTLRDAIAAPFKAMFEAKSAERHAAAQEFWALRDVSLVIQRGERVGIIGLNGAGKSTLLKILSRIVEPTTGTARIAGRVGALLEVGTGFHAELTGRENIHLYGAILGMSKSEVNNKFNAIVEFSGVGQFIDVPVKRYSSGMYVRLAFSVAAHLEPEILLLDEVLAVGDLPFQRKCLDYTQRLQKRNATILFVSHNMFSIKNMCERVIYLRQGRICFDGSVEEGLERYEEDCHSRTLSWFVSKPHNWAVEITNVEISNVSGAPALMFEHGESLCLRIQFRTQRALEHPNFIVVFIRSDGVACCNFSTALDSAAPELVDGEGVIELVTPPLKLVAERYAINIIVREHGFGEIVCGQHASAIHVKDGILDTHFGVFHEPGQWRWMSVEARAVSSASTAERLSPP